MIVGREFNDQIVNTTSVMGSHSTRSTAKLDIRVPAAKWVFRKKNFFRKINFIIFRGKHNLSVYILSDCYMGIDQEYTLRLDVC